MSLYEHILIARQDISAAQVDSITDALTGVITDGGGEVKKKEYWGLRSLAYKIKKNRKGHYVLLNIDAPSAAVQEMERQERLHEDILRHLTIRVEELEEEPSVMMKNKAGRDDRGPRGRFRDGPGHRDGPRRADDGNKGDTADKSENDKPSDGEASTEGESA